MKIKLSVDTHCIKDTPKANIPYSVISKTIAKYPRELSLDEIANVIENGYTISSPIYKNNEKKKENVIEMQLFILDFDGDDRCKLEYNDALKRAEDYDLPVAISYETKSSVDFGRYRLMFLYNKPVNDIRVMNIINLLLLHIFPEADGSTKDISKMFLPGRNVRFHGGKPFHFDTLIIAAKSFCKRSTWTALIKNFQVKYGMIIKDNDIYLSDEFTTGDFGDLWANSININMESVRISPKSGGVKYIHFSENKTEKGIKITGMKPNEKARIKNSSIIKEECALMRDFIEGNRLCHSEWFGLATNLINIKGGISLFKNTFDQYSDLYGNVNFKKDQVEYASRMNYKPQNCDEFCPYSNVCQHSANMVTTLQNRYRRMKRILGYSERFSEINNIRRDIRDFFCNAASNNYAVNILKAPTGSGKSAAHLDFLRNFDYPTINAYPNSKLMLEKYYEAVSMGINAVYTPVIDGLYPYLTHEQEMTIKSLYEIGAGELPIKLLKKWSKENKFIQAYLNSLENLPEDAHIFTTHSRLFRFPENITRNSVVFIDEDIIPQMIGCSAVSVDEFDKFYGMAGNDFLKTKLSIIKSHLTDNSNYFHLEEAIISAEYKMQFTEQSASRGISFSQNIWGLAESKNYYYNSTERRIHFTVTNSLNHFGKIIMMSATANKTICEKIFGGLLNFCDMGLIKYKGKVIIHDNNTFSRAYLSNNSAEKVISQIIEKHGDCVYITFKDYCKYIGNNLRKTHYGQAVGTNDFNGEDLVIIGLNHRPFYVYELFARELGINCSDTLSTRKVSLNGFEFYMMTYSDSELQNIQQYMIGSDLEQAIGRARLIYHDCTVHLYGNYPARQGTLSSEITINNNCGDI